MHNQVKTIRLLLCLHGTIIVGYNSSPCKQHGKTGPRMEWDGFAEEGWIVEKDRILGNREILLVITSPP